MPDERFRLVDDPADDGAALTVLSPSLDMDDGGPFELRCRDLLSSGRRNLTIDLCGVEHVASTVLTAIVNAEEGARRDGRMLTVRCRRLVGNVLDRLVGGSVEILD